MPAAAIAIPALIGIGGSIIGGAINSNAASSAANTQVAAANAAASGVDASTTQANQDILAAQQRAVEGQAAATGTAINTVNNATQTATQGVTDAAAQQGAQVVGTAETGATAAEEAARQAAAGVTGAAGQANELLNPYVTAGADATRQLSSLVAPGGEFSRNFGEGDFQVDPGYQFRLAEGAKALQRSAAARGGVSGGGILKALTRYSSGVASEEYGKAFDRFMAQRQQRTGVLSNLSGAGLTAAGRSGENLTTAARDSGGFNVRGAEFGATTRGTASRTLADLVTGASTFAGNAGIRAGEFAGNAGIRSGEYAGNTSLAAVGQTSGNLLDASRYRGEAGMQAANARAAGTVGRANAWSGAISNGTKPLSDLLSGTFGKKKDKGGY